MSDPEEHESALEAEAPEAPETEQEAPEAPSEDVEQRARTLGWKPEAEWKGEPPPKGFMSAEQFVEKFGDTPYEVQRLRERTERQAREFEERVKRIEAMSQKALDRQRQQLEARMDAAVESGDVDSYRAAKTELQGLDKQEPQQPVGPPPETQAWMAANPWFGVDRAKTAVARDAVNEAYQAGKSIAEQLAYADKVISEAFGQPKKTVSAVDAGGMQAPRKRGKSWEDIPAQERGVIERHIGRGIFKDRAEAAREYWADNG